MAKVNNQAGTTLRHITFVFNGRFPSEQTHALFVAKSAEAFIALGYGVTVLAPDHHEGKKINAQEYFNLKYNIDVVYLKTPNFRRSRVFKKMHYFYGNIVLALKAKQFIQSANIDGNIVYTNDHTLLPFLRNFPICYELHDFPERFHVIHSSLYQQADKILVTNKWKEHELHKYFPSTRQKTFVELNAVDLTKYDLNYSQQEARHLLSLDQSVKIALYTGHLFGWKGAEMLLGVAKKLPEIKFYFIGGKPADIELFKAKAKALLNVYVVGHQPHEKIPLWQKSADVLVLPNTAKQKISKYYTSPMKLFEYLASGVPVVASELPSVKEIVSEKEVYFAEADNVSSFVDTIKFALSDVKVQSRIDAGLESVRKHTWMERAKRISKQLELLDN